MFTYITKIVYNIHIPQSYLGGFIMKKELFTFFVLFSFLLSPISAFATDMPSNWAAESVAKAIELRLVPEELQGDYQAVITRGEFAKMAVTFLIVAYDENRTVRNEAFGFQDKITTENLLKAYSRVRGDKDYQENVFTDTNDLYINLAYATEIVSGEGDGTFQPDRPITRQEACVMLQRAAFAGGYMIVSNERGSEFIKKFRDFDKIDQWAVDASRWTYSWHVMSGISENQFDPNGMYTREQCITTFLKLPRES